MTIQEIERNEAGYPPLLALISDAPQKLYYCGDLSIAKELCVAVVGTRKPTEYGRWAAFQVGKRLAEAGATVVSGMAAGIDSLAHRGALEAGGNTIAVLGHGLDRCFPATNERLMREIGKKGLLLSEYPSGYPASKFTFPRRNRIISGLSRAVVIVEAGLASGSLITAERAAEQGRDVYALPGNISSIMSLGTNKLICDGAQPIAVIDDLLADLKLFRAPDEALYKTLRLDERKIVDALAHGGEMTVNELCGVTQLAAGTVNGIITVLEIKGLVCTALGKVFLNP